MAEAAAGAAAQSSQVRAEAGIFDVDRRAADMAPRSKSGTASQQVTREPGQPGAGAAAAAAAAVEAAAAAAAAAASALRWTCYGAAMELLCKAYSTLCYYYYYYCYYYYHYY